MKAIDISSWQGNVNMKAVRDSGVERVILRSGYGKRNYDPKYVQNAQAMVNLGIQGGIYHFSYAYTNEMARDEGYFALEAAKKFWTRCYIAYDFEYDSVNYARKHGVNPTKAMVTQFAIGFLKPVAEAGYIPVLYLNQDYWNSYFDVDTIRAAIPKLKIWYAYWASSLPASKVGKVDIWQYSSKGSVPGIGGNVDMDEVYDSAEAEGDIFPQPVTPDQINININIQNFQKAVNADGYSMKALGEDLVADGIDGPKTQRVRKSFYLYSKYVDEDWLVGSTGETVKWLQTRLNEMGYNAGAVDGLYGNKTRLAVLQFQAANHLYTDGVAGYNTNSRMFYV